MTDFKKERIISRRDLTDRRYVFRDRGHAGEILAAMLREDDITNGFVLGIPAGGVPVGIIVADRLGLPFDVAVVSKITLPDNTEAGDGAVAFDGTLLLNETFLEGLSLSDRDIARGIAKTTEKVRRRVRSLRADHPFPPLAGRTTIVVDDGLASGFTMRTAIDAISKNGADRIVVAVPTGHTGTVSDIARRVDALYCANIRCGFSFAVADAYQHWYDVDESEVSALLHNLHGTH